MVDSIDLPDALFTPRKKLRGNVSGIVEAAKHRGLNDEEQEFIVREFNQFIAWDGEGWTDNDGRQYYMLLACSKGRSAAAVRLHSRECLNLILDVARDYPEAIHVGFGFGYDVAHILRDMPPEKRKRLKEEGKVHWHVDDDEYGNRNHYVLEYIPNKWFTVTGWDWRIRKNVKVRIWDVMTFFQTSFMGALRSRKIDVPEVIASGKASRADFRFEDLEEVAEYCGMELELLVKLCDQLRSEFQEAAIPVKKWHGPGAVANVIFQRNRIRQHMLEPTRNIELASQRAYFGGRFEQFKAGHHEGKVYVYDINSAYPYHISRLPSLAGARWVYTENYDPEAIGVWNVGYSSPTGAADPIPHPLPWRGKSGAVGFPAQNEEVWVWHPEAKHASWVNFGFVLADYNRDARPFHFVPNMFATRKRWKAEGKGGERALKLGMNSLYGKMAQRVGGSENNGGRPPWHQLEWAGIVTSSVRAQIYEAIMKAPEAIVAVETDSVASLVPLDLELGDELGQWEFTEYDWMTYVQSGIYFASDQETAKAKTRGINVSELNHAQVLHYMDDPREPLLVRTRQFHGLTSPHTWNYGNWTDGVKEVKVAGSKRIHMEANCHACQDGLRMSEHMHTLTANPLYGHEPSRLHPLPWLDGEDVESARALLEVDGEAAEPSETTARYSELVG